MNYLAHAYLSFKKPDILVGNLISDFVKGKKKFNYSVPIQRGIALHRMIDEFTDSHAATSRGREFFRPVYGLYSGAFIDIVYDHFLANDKKEFPGDALADFSQLSYEQLEPYKDIFPEKFQVMFHYMRMQNWLYNYQFKKGIHNSFIGMVRRAKYMNDALPAFDIFENNYEELKKCYEEFFPTVKNFAFNELKKMDNTDQKNPDIR